MDEKEFRALIKHCKKVHKVVLKDRKAKLREIADTLKVSEGSVLQTLVKSFSRPFPYIQRESTRRNKLFFATQRCYNQKI
ncbi:hypothetical protein WN51_05955 [Melipona quadrifasciata]|uniref:Mos1 transposase HTH domain-containing protein n=1 Tax=Melipona quadrifasciata TaxID=166423 RepID=A0A0M9A679_9HYME|nr:hypothetical protein WN51_05955 [Melipona quadrifasciata]